MRDTGTCENTNRERETERRREKISNKDREIRCRPIVMSEKDRRDTLFPAASSLFRPYERIINDLAGNYVLVIKDSYF